MSGATQIQATIDLSGTGYVFTGVPFTGNVFINMNPLFPVIANLVFTPIALSTLVTSLPALLTPPLVPGPYVLGFITTSDMSGVTSPAPVQNTILGTITLTFDDTPPTTSPTVDLTVINLGTGSVTDNIFVTIMCLHGSSLIQMKEGSKRLDQIQINDEVLTHDLHGGRAYAKVKGMAQCWLTNMGVDHDAIVFEPGSLSENEPTQRLIIDPGHPMCTKKEYLEKGYDALRPAGTYWEELKSDKVYTKKWTDIFIQAEPSVRYDLILEEPYNTYVANGIVVRSKGNKDHRYKEFV